MRFKTAHFRQKTSHISTLGAAFFLTGAFLLTSGIFTAAYSQDRKTKKGGNTVLLMQTGAFKSIEQAKKDTTKTMDTIPKLVIPDVRTLEHYMPYPSLNDSVFARKDRLVELYRDVWREDCDLRNPFGLSDKVINSYSPKDKAELMRRWEIAKTELVVAFLSDRGATPTNALKIHTPEEVKKMLRDWKIDKDLMHQKITIPDVK